MNKNVLFIFAHQDDEVAFSTRIVRETGNGNHATCVFLTDGAGNGHAPRRRDLESERVLVDLGVEPGSIHFIGSQHAIPDGALPEHIDRAFCLMEQALSGMDFQRVYCMAYEGGHQDHDASHLAAIVFSLRRGLLGRTWQMPLYNGYRTSGKLFRVLSPLPAGNRRFVRRLSLSEAFSNTLLAFRYPSQWKTWALLFPGYLFQRLIMRRESLQTVSSSAFNSRPHENALLYERLFSYSYDTFRESADRFLALHEAREDPDRN